MSHMAVSNLLSLSFSLGSLGPTHA